MTSSGLPESGAGCRALRLLTGRVRFSECRAGFPAPVHRECYVIKGGKIVYKDTGVTDKQADNVLAFLASDKKS